MVFSLQNCFSKKSEGTNVKNFVVSLGYRPFTGLRYKKRFEMRNTKIYSILKEFDKYEQNRLRKFLESPYFNKDHVLVRLFDLIICEINTSSNQHLEKEDLWIKLDLLTSYDDVRLRKYFSDLTKLVEGFLCQELYEENTFQKASYLMQAAAKRKIEKLYNNSTKNAKDVLEKYPFRSTEYYYFQYAIESNYYDLLEYSTKRDQRSNIENISNYLDYFYIIEKLKFLCTILLKQNIANYTYSILLKDELIEHIKSNLDHYKDIPPIYIYYYIYLTLTDPSEEDHYFKLKELLNKYSQLFPVKFAVDEFYSAAQNYCVTKLNQGNQKFVKEVVDLYKDMMNKKLLVIEGELSPWIFRNAVVLGLRLGETDWVEEFINVHKNYLPEAMRENAVTFNLAQVYFYQKRYDKVKVLLQEVEFEDYSYNLVSKSMLLAIYYETDEIEPLYSLFESFRTYLNRQKELTQARRQNYANLIKFTKKLTKIVPSDKKAIQKLKQELESTKNVASHAWLMEKIAELE